MASERKPPDHAAYTTFGNIPSKVTFGESFTSETPQRLFEQPGRLESYAVSPDGTQFLVSVADPDAMAREIHVVLNWFEELLERVPVP